MNNETKLDGALCAGVGTAEALGAAPASGKKKYVSPTMQVIPLGPQRLLATSGEEPPIHVTIYGVPATDYYLYYLGSASCVNEPAWVPGCSSLVGHTVWPEIEYRAGNMHYGITQWDSHRCVGDYDEVGQYAGHVFIDGADWDAGAFLSGAEFDECSDSSRTFSGTYLGRRFTGEIIPLEIDDFWGYIKW